MNLQDAQTIVKDWMMKFDQETPSTNNPTIPSLEVRKLRAKLQLSECLELLVKGLGIEALKIQGSWLDLRDLMNQIESNKVEYNGGGIPNIIEIADGCADIEVVNLGTAVACGINIQPVFDEVMLSNNSKMWTFDEVVAYNKKDLIFKACKPNYEHDEHCWLALDKDNKVIKSPSYKPAQIKL